MNPHGNQEPEVRTAADRADGGHPAGELRPESGPPAGRRTAILAGIVVAAVAAGAQVTPTTTFGFTTFPSAPN
jgi:hypothetical protein